MNGRPGFFAVTPLRLADGTAVLVQRGWLPRDAADRTRIALPPLPSGAVRVPGHVAPPPSQLFDFAGAASGPIRQNLELAAYARETGLALRPLSIVQEDDAVPAQDGLLREWPQPALDVSRNYGYAFQWFAMSALIIGLYAWFQLIRPRWPRRA
jgi:surfeit locus 1 family protein